MNSQAQALNIFKTNRQKRSTEHYSIAHLKKLVLWFKQQHTQQIPKGAQNTSYYDAMLVGIYEKSRHSFSIKLGGQVGVKITVEKFFLKFFLFLLNTG